MKIRAIITGVTGMVGEGVLHECLLHPDVEQVLVITRKPTGTTHPKLKEVLHFDFMNLAPIAAEMKGYNACYFCLGVTSVGRRRPSTPASLTTSPCTLLTPLPAKALMPPSAMSPVPEPIAQKKERACGLV